MSQSKLKFFALLLLFILIPLIVSVILNRIFNYNVIVLFSSFITVIGLVLSLYQVTYVKPVINQKYVSEDPELVGEVMTLVKNMSETNAKYNEKKINELKEKSREVNKTLNEIVISDSEREELKKKIESMEERRKEFEDKMDLNSDSSE